jgi:hypothetical protein
MHVWRPRPPDDETVEHEPCVHAIDPGGNFPNTASFRFTIVKPRQA